MQTYPGDRQRIEATKTRLMLIIYLYFYIDTLFARFESLTFRIFGSHLLTLCHLRKQHIEICYPADDGRIDTP